MQRFVHTYELIVDSAWLYAARTVGVLGLILYLFARNALVARLRLVFTR